jgi:hypothetical protein
MCKSRGPAAEPGGPGGRYGGMLKAKSNWLKDLTKICSWYMDDGALLVDSPGAIPDSMQHVMAACTFAFYVVPLEPNLCTGFWLGEGRGFTAVSCGSPSSV